MKILQFQGQWRWLSNFWPCSILMEDEIRYPSAEHAYQAMKTLDMGNRRFMAQQRTPGEAKRTGRILTTREGWDRMKIAVMEDVVWRKFDQNLDLRQKLLALPEDTEFEEGNHWGDRFWGICPAGTVNGLNHLGRIIKKTHYRFLTGRY